MSSIQLSTALLNGALGEIDSTVWNEQEGETREGSLHFCQGPLRRKRHRAQAKVNKWKQKWFRVEPGKANNSHERRFLYSPASLPPLSIQLAAEKAPTS